MIDIIPNFDAQLVTDVQNHYEENILPRIRDYSETILIDEKKDIFNNIFSNDEVISLINATPDAIEAYSNRVYTHFPEFAERYHPHLIYKKITEDLSIFETIKNTTGNEEIITEKAHSVITAINESNTANHQELFRAFKTDLVGTNTKKLYALKRIQGFKSQNYKITKPYINSLPEWTRSPFNMFNYDAFRGIFGRRIIEAHSLSSCPFCAHDSVEIINGVRKNHLPALDHYLPKSKYPFLALSLQNLLPTCHKCNTSFKGETDTYQAYYHPLRDRIYDINIFNFHLALDTPFDTPPPETLSIFIKSNNDKVMKNAALFELDSLYNLSQCKKIFFDARERYEFHKNKGVDSISEILSSNYLTRIQIAIDREADPKRHPLQKFKLEVLKKISEDLLP